jgi:hypothetical protein
VDMNTLSLLVVVVLITVWALHIRLPCMFINDNGSRNGAKINVLDIAAHTSRIHPGRARESSRDYIQLNIVEPTLHVVQALLFNA